MNLFTGHVDFSAEVTAALRLTDGAIVVVDCVEGVCIQTELVLRQALQEHVRPILFLNKLDRCFAELQLEPEAAYTRLAQTVAAVNTVIETYQPLGVDFTVHPEKGNVAFGSGLHGWAFSLPVFAASIAQRQQRTTDPSTLRAAADKLLPRLWGDNFLDRSNGKWRATARTSEGVQLQRGFCALVLEPIYALFTAARDGNTGDMLKMAAKLNLNPTKEDVEAGGKTLQRAIMKQWLPVADQLLKLVELHLPSPIEAQRYRAPLLYDGPSDDEYCQAMAACRADGPVMVYVSKMMPASAKAGKQFYAFGRIFSGTISTGQKVCIMGPNYLPGNKDDLFEARIGGVVQLMASRTRPLESASAGQIVGILGLDKHIAKSCTVTSSLDAFPMKACAVSLLPLHSLINSKFF